MVVFAGHDAGHRPGGVRVRGAEEDGVFGHAGLLGDGLADLVDGLAVDEQRVEADQGDAVLAVVENGRADLAGIVQGAVIRLAVAAGGLGADLRRDVAFGEPGLEDRRLGPSRRCGNSQAIRRREAREDFDKVGMASSGWLMGSQRLDKQVAEFDTPVMALQARDARWFVTARDERRASFPG